MSSGPSSSAAPQRFTTVQWLICFIAALGFAFDTYELLMAPLITRPAIESLGKIKFGTPEYFFWVQLLFYVPAMVGGLFGLLGGYLTDVLGRRRVLTFSILLYAFSAFAAGYVASLPMLLVLRCTTLVGVCVEFVAAVAWLAELFPHPEQRERVLGYTQAFASFGGLMVSGMFTLISWLVVHHPEWLPPIHGLRESWRYTLISGVIPALPLIIIRPFLPESPVWAAKKAAGTLKRPSFGELFAPNLIRTTLVTTLVVACGYAVAFGAIQQLAQIVPGLPEIRDLPRPQQQPFVGQVQLWQEIGGLAGRLLLAFLAVRILSRQRLLRVFLIPGLMIVPFVFFYPAVTGLTMLKVGIFFAGLFTVAQFSFWGNYLPRVYPVHLRGTGESFAANVGGRIIGTSAALVTTTIAGSEWIRNVFPDYPPAKLFAYTAGAVAASVFLLGLIGSFFLPEPLPESSDEG